jgi:exonuclease VII large subunit
MGLNMEELSEMLEHELESAVEVKDKNSLHRYIRLLVDNTAQKQWFDIGLGEVKSDVRMIAERMDHGFKLMEQRFNAMDDRFETMQVHMDKRFEALQIQMDKRFEALQTQMDKRFEAVDKRFDDVNKRFDALQSQMNSRFNSTIIFSAAGFTVIATLMSLFKFLL